MMMTKNEIKASYKSARNKRKQLKILAELNNCSKDEIKAILEEREEDYKQKEQEEFARRMVLARRLQTIRKASGFNGEALMAKVAEKGGHITLTHLSRYETGQCGISPINARIFAEIFETDPRFFLDPDFNPTSESTSVVAWMCERIDELQGRIMETEKELVELHKEVNSVTEDCEKYFDVIKAIRC